MIRDVKDVTALLDRWFGAAGKGSLSLLRVAVWFVVGLVVAGSLIAAPKVDINQTHYNSLLKTRAVRDPLLDMTDPRGYVQQKPNKHVFRIAWVGSSTMQNVGKHPSFIPADVLQRIPKIAGKPVHIDMYLLEAGRLMDTYNAVQEAIATKPDLIMVDLNPVWLFNDRMLQQWENLNGPDFPVMVRNPSNWRLLAALDTPIQVALGTVGSKVSILRNRWSYNGELQKWLAKLTLLKQSGASSSATGGGSDQAGGNAGSTGGGSAPTGLARIARMQSPLDFWNFYRPITPVGAPTRVNQEGLVKSEKPDGSTLSEAILTKMFAALAESKIPSAAYLPATDPTTFSDPGVESALTHIENRVRRIASQNRASNVLVRSRSAIRYVHGLTFKDMFHLTTDAPMVGYLARLLCARVNASYPNAHCAPRG